LIANKDLEAQADSIRSSLRASDIKAARNREIVALIAYLQRLGKDIKAAPKETIRTEAQTSVLGN